MVLGSLSIFSECGLVWKDISGQTQLRGTGDHIRRESTLHSELKTLGWTMESMLHHLADQDFGTDFKYLIEMIKEPQAWAIFST